MTAETDTKPVIGVIGGSGVYDLEGLTNARWESVDTPFGAPSDQIRLGELAGVPMAFLPRHGRGHPLPPTDVPYRANIAALKQLGVTDIIALSAVGSLREDLSPGTFVIVDQFVDRTIQRAKSFFGPGLVAHVPMAHPVCGRLGDRLEASAGALGLPTVRGGTYIAMEGPQFSTLAESELYRQWGLDVVGMTNMPEAKLAREAEICYATVAMVTDYDCWHAEHASVAVTDVLRVLKDNAAHARSLIAETAREAGARPQPCPHGCDRVLDTALITPPEARDPDMKHRLASVAGRVLSLSEE